jgi:hypothetical protein
VVGLWFQRLLGVLLLMSMGSAQLSGVARGYWCFCTAEAKVVAEPVCQPEACHDGHMVRAEHGEEDGHDGDQVRVALDFSSGEHPLPAAPCAPDHQHREAREGLKLTAVATSIFLPEPLLTDAGPWWPVPLRRVGPPMAIQPTVPRFDTKGNASTPVLVARAVVRLV